MTIKANELVLKTARDYRGLGGEIDKALEKVIELNYGKYKINKKDKHIWLILEGMCFLNEHYNKGVKFIGDYDTQLVEIYDYKKLQAKKDEAYLKLDL